MSESKNRSKNELVSDDEGEEKEQKEYLYKCKKKEKEKERKKTTGQPLPSSSAACLSWVMCHELIVPWSTVETHL